MSPTRVYPIAKAPRRGWGWFFVLAGLFALLPISAVLLMWFWPSDVRFEVSADGVAIRGSYYGRTIAAANIDPDRVRRIPDAEKAKWTPTSRTNGVGIPGYQAGWFRLPDGRDALLFVSDWGRIVELATRAGEPILVSPADPDGFVNSVRQAKQGTSVFPMADAPKGGFSFGWIALSLGFPLILVGGLALLAIRGGQVEFVLDDDALRIRGSMFGRNIPRASLDAGAAELVKLRGHEKYGRMLRVGGVGLPNYLAGWFRPRGGGRALLFVTNFDQVVAIPTSEGFDLLVSPADPDAFLDALRGGGPAAPTLDSAPSGQRAS